MKLRCLARSLSAGIAIFTLLASMPAAVASNLYAASSFGGLNELYILDPATGAVVTDIGPLKDVSGNPYAITGLAFSPSTGTLYGSTATASPTSSQALVTINPTTAQVSVVGGGFGSPGTMADFTFDPKTGALYGVDSTTANLYKINLGTGTAALVGQSGITGPISGAGLASDGAGVFYGTPKGASGPLVRYDKTTGAATVVVTLTAAPNGGSGAVSSLVFDCPGTLYGLDVNPGNSAGSANLVKIDPVSGAVTDLGLTPINVLDDGGNTVPEPSTILLLASGLGGLLGSRRRGRTQAA